MFVAFDDQLSRELALKRLRPELPHCQRRVRRFIREAEITAKLQHPGIVPIYSLNVAGSDSHYTMPLVSGSTMEALIQEVQSRHCNSRFRGSRWNSDFRPLLTHFIAVCNAVGYAHTNDVLHRDLKPANIIIGSQGQTLVLDWGCAKNIGDGELATDSIFEDQGIENDDLAAVLGIGEASNMTVAGSVMGTVQFMSPEQASGDLSRVGIPSDIFGLGATLFYLLTGEYAFRYDGNEKDQITKALEQIISGKHRRIEDVSSLVPRPLAAICHRAIAKDPADRYATADELGRDVDAYLAGEPVSAYAEPFSDKAMRFVWRYQTLCATILGTLIVGCLSLVLITLMINRQRTTLSHKNQELASLNGRLEDSVVTERRLLDAAVDREKSATERLYETQMLLASEASSEPGGIGRMRELVDRWSTPEFGSSRGWEWRHLQSLGNRERGKVKLDATANQVLTTRDSERTQVFDAGRSLLLTIDTTNNQIVDQTNLPKDVTAVDFNHDQSLLAMGFRSGRVKVISTTEKDTAPVEFKKLNSEVTDLCWNIGGDMLATCDSSGEMAVWQWHERKVIGSGKDVLKQSAKQLLCWSFDGQQVCWTTGRQLRTLDLSTMKEEVVAKDNWIENPCWSHEGKLLAYIGPENTIVVEDLENDRSIKFLGHQLFVESLAWHPSMHYLASSSSDGSVRLWNADTEKPVDQLLGHTGHVYSAAWTSDGQRIVSGGLPEDSLLIWDVSKLGSEAFERELQDHPAVAWHSDGSQLVVAEGSDIVIQNDQGNWRWIRNAESGAQKIFGIDINSAGTQIACVSRRGRIWTTDFESGKTIHIYDSGNNKNLFPNVGSKGVAWSYDGKFLAGVGSSGKVRVWDVATGDDISCRLPKHGKAMVVAWGPAGTDRESQLALAGTHDNVFVFDATTKKVTATVHLPGWKSALDWSPDGNTLAIADRRSLSMWRFDETGNPEIVGKCEGPSAMVSDITWSSSQDRIAALTEDGKLCLWNSETWAYVAKFDLHERTPYSAHWSPDGERLVSTARHGRIVFQESDQKEK